MPTQAQTASAVAAQYLSLHLADAIGPVLLGRLIKHFDRIEHILAASPAALMEVHGIGERRARAIAGARSSDAAERELERATGQGVRIICWEDAEYPTQLRHCHDPPVCLYVSGQLQPEDAVAVAVVGARKCTQYGREQSERLASLLARAGFTVVSGLARGIDAHAHRGAMAAEGRTIAVLGSGLDCVYPPEHAEMARRVAACGALISEDPLGSPPTADSFPRRNRIIAALCLGVIVVEASKRSGALITARLASEYHREVFAVPGRVDMPTAYGTNDLIRSGGAKLVASLEDVLDELGETGRIMSRPQTADDARSATPARRRSVDLAAPEQCIVDALDLDEVHVDEIAGRTGLAAGAVAAALTTLQLKGQVVALPGNRFARRTA